jgi:hypothetical protein
MKMTLAWKPKQFPSGGATDGDVARSFGQAAASSFTRNGRGQSATAQRALEREVAHCQRCRQNFKKEKRCTDHYTICLGHFTDLVTLSIVTHIGPLLKFLKHRDTGPGYAPDSAHHTTVMELWPPSWCRDMLPLVTPTSRLSTSKSTPRRAPQMSTARLLFVLIVYKNALEAWFRCLGGWCGYARYVVAISCDLAAVKTSSRRTDFYPISGFGAFTLHPGS